MPTYHYEITNASGQPVRGSASAASLPALASQMAQQGWRVERLLPDPAKPPSRYWRHISTQELATFLRQLAVMLRNQVPVPEAVALAARECRNPVFQTVLYQVEAAVRSGEPLSGALGRYPRLFAPMHAATLESGEASNCLELVAERLADYAERVDDGVRRLRNAAVYPTIVSFITALLLCFTFLFIVPKFMELMRDLGVKELPFLTQVLVTLSKWAVPVVLVVALPPALLALITLGVQRGRSPVGLDVARLKLPVLGPLFEAMALYRLSAMLSVFLEGRTPLLDALRLAGQASENVVIQGAVWDTIPRVAEGERLGRALDATGVIPADFCGQVSVAEENGDLPATLHRLAGWYAGRMEGITERIGRVLEPIFVVCIGGFVGLVALGLFSPLIMIIKNLTGGPE